jgi:hypothetical protein
MWMIGCAERWRAYARSVDKADGQVIDLAAVTFIRGQLQGVAHR